MCKVKVKICVLGADPHYIDRLKAVVPQENVEICSDLSSLCDFCLISSNPDQWMERIKKAAPSAPLIIAGDCCEAAVKIRDIAPYHIAACVGTDDRGLENTAKIIAKAHTTKQKIADAHERLDQIFQDLVDQGHCDATDMS